MSGRFDLREAVRDLDRVLEAEKSIPARLRKIPPPIPPYFRVVVPNFSRQSDDLKDRILLRYNVFPPVGVLYDFRAAVDVLDVFVARYREAYLKPCPMLEAFAELLPEADKPSHPFRFTLWEIRPWEVRIVFRNPPNVDKTPLPPPEPADVAAYANRPHTRRKRVA